MPCYEIENVEAQRGNGVFEKSIAALQQLNALGYGREPWLPLHLVYNPVGTFLTPPQGELEARYKHELQTRFGIVFNQLYCLNNLPVARFASYLKLCGKYEEYSSMLESSFNPLAVDSLMCRDTISVGWRGEVYDCDFNQMLDWQWQDENPLFLWDIDNNELNGRTIATGDHCFGCTAGAGSSCSGALT
jgi:radical SAM/Cys-rich protein